VGEKEEAGPRIQARGIKSLIVIRKKAQSGKKGGGKRKTLLLGRGEKRRKG